MDCLVNLLRRTDSVAVRQDSVLIMNCHEPLAAIAERIAPDPWLGMCVGNRRGERTKLARLTPWDWLPLSDLHNAMCAFAYDPPSAVRFGEFSEHTQRRRMLFIAPN
ncbi:hypothetical protein WK32_32660 [Burkholderia vietnamiensis]|nr:hypothetical protein WK32_32660 [Burkholderia vietnamiensis]